MRKNIFKNLFLGFAAILMVASVITSRAQSKAANPKVYAVINKAAWCPACKKNEQKIVSEVIPACKELSVAFVGNDMTDESTTEHSKKDLKSKNLYTSVQEYKATGMILLIDANTKKVVKTISVSEPAEKIIKEITKSQG